jgi:hypothetical protein
LLFGFDDHRSILFFVQNKYFALAVETKHHAMEDRMRRGQIDQLINRTLLIDTGAAIQSP